MCPTASATPLRCCSVSLPIPRRGSCSSTVRFRLAHVPTTLLIYSAPGTTAHIPLFLYPFLNTTSKTRPFEYLRLTSLGVIGALVKVHHPVQFCHPRLLDFVFAYSSIRSKTTTQP